MLYRDGDKTLPCGTPNGTGLGDEVAAPHFTWKVLFLMNECIILIKNGGHLFRISLCISPSCQTESKAFSMSSVMMPTDFLAPSFWSMMSETLFNWCVVE